MRSRFVYQDDNKADNDEDEEEHALPSAGVGLIPVISSIPIVPCRRILLVVMVHETLGRGDVQHQIVQIYHSPF